MHENRTNSMAATHNEYVPGVCNIGRKEVEMRRAMGWVSAAVGIALLVAAVALQASPAWRLALFVPAFLSALGFLQARRGFCVQYGLAGALNFGERIGRTSSVPANEHRRQDRRSALAIIAQAAAIATILSLAAYWLPLLV
jgi:hypothetical protein